MSRALLAETTSHPGQRTQSRDRLPVARGPPDTPDWVLAGRGVRVQKGGTGEGQPRKGNAGTGEEPLTQQTSVLRPYCVPGPVGKADTIRVMGVTAWRHKPPATGALCGLTVAPKARSKS